MLIVLSLCLGLILAISYGMRPALILSVFMVSTSVFAASATIKQGTVVIHFVSPLDIAKMSRGKAVAFSFPSRTPCEIYLPSGMWLWGDEKNFPYRGMFINSDDAGLVAHEILHCAISSWHPQ